MSAPTLIPCSPELFYRGRPGDPRLGEWVKVGGTIPLQKIKTKEAIAILGFPDDEGVVRNKGRAGAKGGPDGVRKHFYRLCPPMDLEWEKFIELYDLGNIQVTGQIDSTHVQAKAAVSHLASLGATIVTIGGGHDFAAPAFLGFKAGQEESARKALKCSLLNVDPHLDMRPLEANLPHSGTPFRVILEANGATSVTAFGIRQNRNARSHYQYAKDKGVRILALNTIRADRKGVGHLFEAELKKLARSSDLVGVTLDLDSCFESEGTSAAPVLGFSAWELCEMALSAGREKKVKWFDLSEAAPHLESAERICRIASEIIFHFLWGRAQILAGKGAQE